jgi:hypothetical protein
MSMSTQNISPVAPHAVKSRNVARKPLKVKADQDVVRVTLLLPAEDVREIDAEAKRRTLAERESGSRSGRIAEITRSDVIRSYIREALTKT